MPFGTPEPTDTIDATAYNAALTLSPNGLTAAMAAARTIVSKISPRGIKATGNVWRVTMQGPFSITGLWLGPAADSGHAWNFSAAHAVLWDGVAAKAVTDNAVYISDALTFEHDPSRALCVAMNAANASQMPFSFGTPDAVSYWLAATEGASLTKSAGYAAQRGVIYGVQELRGAP